MCRRPRAVENLGSRREHKRCRGDWVWGRWNSGRDDISQPRGLWRPPWARSPRTSYATNRPVVQRQHQAPLGLLRKSWDLCGFPSTNGWLRFSARTCRSRLIQFGYGSASTLRDADLSYSPAGRGLRHRCRSRSRLHYRRQPSQPLPRRFGRPDITRNCTGLSSLRKSGGAG